MAGRARCRLVTAAVGALAVACLPCSPAAAPAFGAFPGANSRIAMDYLGGVFSLRPDAWPSPP
jgi:hypothetical protein